MAYQHHEDNHTLPSATAGQPRFNGWGVQAPKEPLKRSWGVQLLRSLQPCTLWGAVLGSRISKEEELAALYCGETGSVILGDDADMSSRNCSVWMETESAAFAWEVLLGSEICTARSVGLTASAVLPVLYCQCRTA